MKSYDVTVIGSGPGGYVAAIRSAQLGLKTAIVEKYSTLGGTCLNVGCIPSKALLDSSHHYEDAVKHFETHGIEIPGEIKVNLEKMIARKQAVVDQTTGGIDFLMKKNNIDVYHGIGSFKDKTHILVNGDGKSAEEIESKNTIIATGSKPANLPFIKLDKERIITSTEALKLKEVPKHLVVIGGGVIGLELGQVYKRLGAEVTVVEYMDRIIPTMDAGLSKELTKVLKKQKFKINVSHKVKAVGRKAFTDGLGLEAAGIVANDRGQIEVNEHLQTNVQNIYAVGDVIKGAMLAHKAEEEGTMAAEIIAGQKPVVTKARKSIATFKLREGREIGAKVTLTVHVVHFKPAYPLLGKGTDLPVQILVIGSGSIQLDNLPFSGLIFFTPIRRCNTHCPAPLIPSVSSSHCSSPIPLSCSRLPLTDSMELMPPHPRSSFISRLHALKRFNRFCVPISGLTLLVRYGSWVVIPQAHLPV